MSALLKSKRRYFLLLPFAPGWILPRIIGTLAFFSHPTLTGLMAILSWWLLIPLLWWIGFKLLRKFRGQICASALLESPVEGKL